MDHLETRIDRRTGAALAVCDRNCAKAWGVNGRNLPEAGTIDHGEDDVIYLADGETGDAPRDPGTYEGGQGKPFHPAAHNLWCLRECERCAIVGDGEPVAHPDFSVRVYNQPWKHGLDRPSPVTTGRIFRADAPSG